MLVGNFQFVNVITVHFVGAFLAFCGIIGVEFMVATITYKLMYPKWLFILRYVQAKAYTVCFNSIVYKKQAFIKAHVL